MASTLFLSGYLTALADRRRDFSRIETILTRKGGLRKDAGERLAGLASPGDVVACLPLGATQCQTLKVSSTIGRQITHSDMAGALEAALGQAGAPGAAVISGEPGRVLIDGRPASGSPVGTPAQRLDVEVTAFSGRLSFLNALEDALAEADMTLTGVIAMEEAAAASLLADEGEEDRAVIFCDRWTSKIVAFSSRHVARSIGVPIGPGHIADDLAVTFDLDQRKAEDSARRILQDRAHHEERDRVPVAIARLEELASAIASAVEEAEIARSALLISGLAVTPLTERVFAASGLTVRAPGSELPRSDPAIFALATGASKLAGAAGSRTAATALQLQREKPVKGALRWLIQNF